jgi:hypothetical protein
MRLGTRVYLLRRWLTGILRRAFTRLRRPSLRMNSEDPAPGGYSGLIWSTLVVAGRADELAIVRGNLERLQPVIAWANLTVDGCSGDLARFCEERHNDGFHNVLWFSQPGVVSRANNGEAHGHYNRHSLNYLRGWLSNLEPGEECFADLFCHTDGDWEITIRPKSLESLAAFFHRYPQVVAISRPLSRLMKDEPGMWLDKESAGAIWFSDGMLSTNLIISPLDRFRPLLQKAWTVFHDSRSTLFEETLGRVVGESGTAVAYPTLEYFRDHFDIDLVEKRIPLG